MHPFPGHDTVVYRPAEEVRQRAHVTSFALKMGASNLAGLREAALADPDRFWQAVLADLDWRWQTAPEAILDLAGGIASAKWFPGGVTNVVDQVFRPGRTGEAIACETEDGRVAALSWQALHEAALRFAGGLKALGIQTGDRVGILMPMIPETVIAFLGMAALGAVAVPIFSGYGLDAIGARLQDAAAVALVTVDGYVRRGKPHELLDTAVRAKAQSPTVRHLIVVERLGGTRRPGQEVPWEQLLRARPVAPVPVASDHPLMILYTSGTTGRPKGTVHTHTGFPVKAASDLRLCFDLRPSDTLFWFTDMGWMMGPWSILGAGIVGARLVLFEGTPDHPGPDRLWSVIERHRATIFGIAPTAIRALMVHGAAPVDRHDLSALRVLGSTGEPWDPGSWMWYFEKVGKGRLPIVNYSGGTEVSGGIVSGCVTEPLKPCSFNGPVPGMAAAVVDGQGKPCPGAAGELVIRAPWVGMTQGFWGDRERYLETYWKAFPDVWRHGDLACIDDDGFWYLLGRSDDTISVAGKRVSPAEVEAAACLDARVKEAAAVGVPDPLKGEALGLFVVLRPGHEPSAGLAEELSADLAGRFGKPFRPAFIRLVSGLPRTRSGKVMRRAVRASYLGSDPGDLSTLENPEVLVEIAAAGRGPSS